MHAPPTAPRSAPRRHRRSKALGFAALAVSLLMAVPTAQTAFGEESQQVQAVPGGGDLGPNVHVFDPSTPDIQGKVDEIFKKQESAQFGLDRYALLFKPGTYDNINAQIGFY
ncbi:coagulation factor 5/8 type domain-containing protein, partial [Streptomyces sp. SID8455]|nr:coagulation factor 5/8 type domain-containing protein [Streptomyces sp. SID8455]